MIRRDFTDLGARSHGEQRRVFPGRTSKPRRRHRAVSSPWREARSTASSSCSCATAQAAEKSAAPHRLSWQGRGRSLRTRAGPGLRARPLKRALMRCVQVSAGVLWLRLVIPPLAIPSSSGLPNGRGVSLSSPASPELNFAAGVIRHRTEHEVFLDTGLAEARRRRGDQEGLLQPTPDITGTREDECFKEINEAYGVLGDGAVSAQSQRRHGAEGSRSVDVGRARHDATPTSARSSRPPEARPDDPAVGGGPRHRYRLPVAQSRCRAGGRLRVPGQGAAAPGRGDIRRHVPGCRR